MKINLQLIGSLKKLPICLIAMVIQVHSAMASTVQMEQVIREKKVSLNVKQQPITTILAQIQTQTKIDFGFTKNTDPKSMGLFSITVHEKTVEYTLNTLLKDTKYSYQIVANRILIGQKTENPTRQPLTQTVSGHVTDVSGNGIVGVSVTLKERNNIGTTTDAQGYFSLKISSGETVQFSFLGMTPQQIVYTNQKELNVTLKESISEVEEVVVTGIFNKSKESYTGAVRSISAKELKAFKGNNLIATLKNLDPTFNVIENNIEGSNPNALPEIQMRGTSSLPTVESLKNETKITRNTPIIILDGFEISLSKMIDMNDEDIVSITFLKDGAATAIYGSRGANGIIVIESRKPEVGKLRLSYQGNLNLEIPDLSDYDILNAREKLELEVDSKLFIAQRPNFDLDLKTRYSSIKEEIERGVDTYWLSKPLRVGVGHRHNIRLEGGGKDGLSFYASAQYNDVEGVMKSSNRKSFNGDVSILYKFKKLSIRNTIDLSVGESNDSPYGLFSDYVKLNPYWRDKNQDGTIPKELEARSEFWNTAPTNPLYNARLNTVKKNRNTNIINNLNIEWTPIDNLVLRTRLSVEKAMTYSDNFKPSEHTDFNTYSESDVIRRGRYVYGSGLMNRYDWSTTVNYSRTFAEKHSFYVGLDYNLALSKTNEYLFTAEGFPQQNLEHLTMALQYEKDGKPKGTESEDRRVGFTGNISYNYNSRYYFDLSGRIDGSSQFGREKRYAPFYSVGLGWSLHNEQFMADIDWISRLKLRMSYAVTGSVNFPSYQAKTTYSYLMNDRYKHWFGAQLMGIGNENLTWQKTNKWNVGLELGLFNERVHFTGDIYSNETSNLLSEMYMPYRNGFTSYTDNVGVVSNKGIELMLSANLIRNYDREIMWSVSASMIREKNEIVRISEALKQANKALEGKVGSNPNYIYKEGESLRTLYVVRSLGIDPSNGQELYLDRNGNETYVWKAEDKVACGVGEPKFRGNINSMFTFKNLSLNISFAYRLGGKIYNSTLVDRVENADKKYNVDRRVYEKRWMKVGDETFFKDVNNNMPTYMSSRFIQKENTFACQNLNVRYDFRQPWVKKFLLAESFNIGFSTSDLFRISSIKQERGISYPFSRKYTFLLSLTF